MSVSATAFPDVYVANNITRYYVPETIREHIDYITPGIKLLEVSGVRPSQYAKRGSGFKDTQPPVMHPLDVPMSTLTSNPLGLCDKYIFPACIKGEHATLTS